LEKESDVVTRLAISRAYNNRALFDDAVSAAVKMSEVFAAPHATEHAKGATIANDRDTSERPAKTAAVATDDWLEPGEAIAILKLGEKTEPEKRRIYEKLMRVVPDVHKDKRGGVAVVRPSHWRDVCRMLKSRAAKKGDWSEGADDPEDIQQRIAAERARKRHAG
jgi:hypothetical protein